MIVNEFGKLMLQSSDIFNRVFHFLMMFVIAFSWMRFGVSSYGLVTQSLRPAVCGERF